MPVQIHYSDDGKGLWFRGQGKIAGDELLEQITLDDVHFRALRYWLADFTTILAIEISDHDLQAIITEQHRQAKLNPDLVIAVVVNSDYTYGLVRLWLGNIQNISWQTNVFRSLEDAAYWLREMELSLAFAGISINDPIVRKAPG
jgi:hypothetical protein